jgi:hypothetical protein
MIISHRHLDHFDIRSLSYLEKDVPVFIPNDKFMERYLRKVGYTKIETLGDFSEVRLGSTRIFTTRSENRLPEFGVVFADDDAVVWNQVDTVVGSKTIEKVRSRYHNVDLLIASWQPMLEDNFQMNKSLSFPYEQYGQILYNIGLISPGAVTPGANAFCYTGGSAWLNGVVFPISRERFLRDVGEAVPSVSDSAFATDPGDVITARGGTCRLISHGCEFVRRLDGARSILDFSPVTTNGTLIDENPDGVDEETMESKIIAAVENDLVTMLREKSSQFLEHRKWGVIYQLEVVLPNNRLNWVIDFSRPELQVVPGRSPLANTFTYITGSSLYGLITRTRGWDYGMLGGYYRNFKSLYSVSPMGIVRADNINNSDPLHALFPYQEVLTSILDREVELWSRHTVASSA